MFGSVPVISTSIRPPVSSPASISTPFSASRPPLLAASSITTPFPQNNIAPSSLSTPFPQPPIHNGVVTAHDSLVHTSKQLFTTPGFNASNNQSPYSNVTRSHNNSQGHEGSSPGSSFSQVLNVVQHHNDGDRTSPLQVTVTSQLTSGQARSVTIIITDPGDYFFYFSVTLTEDDFTNLRQQQGLLVDFINFPNMLVQLLEKSFSESQSSQPKFVLVLNMTRAQPCLEFTELNLFKHLVHLSLVVLRASDSQLKDYLVTSITKLSKDKELVTAEMQKQLESAQLQLENSLEQLHIKTGELETVKMELSSQTNNLEKRLTKDVEGEKERASQQIQELQWKYEAEKREADSKHAKTIQQLENRIASLDVQNRDLWEVRVGQEASLREARGQLTCRDEEVTRLRRDLAGVRQEKVMVETQGSDRDKQVHQVTSRLTRLEFDLQEKEAAILRMQETVNRGQEEKDRLVAQLEDKVRLVEKRENTIKKLSGEILKANEIIAKLQDGLKQEQGKVKLRGQIATEQEKLLGDRDKELGECRDQLKETKELLDNVNKKMFDMEKLVTDRENKIDELEKVIKTNENVINWLNKQITPGSGGKSGGVAGAKTGGVATKPGGVRGGRQGRQPLTNVQNNTKSSPDLAPGDSGEAGAGLDPKYFVQSTPGGTNYRHQIPQHLPANVRRGAGLVRREV